MAAGRQWLLIGLASAAGLLLFRTAVDFQPGILVCGVILLHFLPGAAMTLMFRRCDPLETVVFGLALGMGQVIGHWQAAR